MIYRLSAYPISCHLLMLLSTGTTKTCKFSHQCKMLDGSKHIQYSKVSDVNISLDVLTMFMVVW